MSHSKRISWTDGGGRAIASATIPRSGGCDFRVCENVYCDRRRHDINTTWKGNSRGESKSVIWENVEEIQRFFFGQFF